VVLSSEVVTHVGTLYVSTGFDFYQGHLNQKATLFDSDGLEIIKRLPPSLILVTVQNHSLLDTFTFPLIFYH
jgi:hypothetical protein